MATHELKTHPEYFNQIMWGCKPFEIRKNDRNFKLSDFLVLKEYDPKTKTYSGRSLMRQVSYIFKGGLFGIPEDIVIMALLIV